MRPCRAQDVLGRRGGGARDHLPHGRVLRGDRLALVVAEREDVQQQRLLDLGAVEEVAAALGRELRVVGQHDRRAEQRVVGVGREHREGVDALAASGGLAAARRSARRRAAGPGGSRAGSRASASARSQALGRPASCCARRASRASARRRGRRPTSARGRAAAPCSNGSTCGSRPGRRAAPRRLEPARDRLVALAARLQEAHLAGQHRIAVGARDALHAQLVERAAASPGA